MTLRELSQLYYLNREIERDQERLAALKCRAASPAGQNLTGMPRGSGFDNRLERMCAEIIDTEAIIAAKITQCVHERNRLERYIADIPDSLTRQVFTLRFVNGLTWDGCAANLGCGNTWKNLSNICYRYIEKSKLEDNEELKVI